MFDTPQDVTIRHRQCVKNSGDGIVTIRRFVELIPRIIARLALACCVWTVCNLKWRDNSRLLVAVVESTFRKGRSQSRRRPLRNVDSINRRAWFTPEIKRFAALLMNDCSVLSSLSWGENFFRSANFSLLLASWSLHSYPSLITWKNTSALSTFGWRVWWSPLSEVASTWNSLARDGGHFGKWTPSTRQLNLDRTPEYP